MAKTSTENKSEHKSVTGPSGTTRLRGTKAGKSHVYLPANHPERSHDGSVFRRNKKKIESRMIEWQERRNRNVKKKAD